MKIMDNLEYIDDYFKNPEQKERREEFEQKILGDPTFAEDVSFYISTHEFVQSEWNAESKMRFRQIYEQQKTRTPKTIVRTIWAYAAAAVVIGIIFGVYFFTKNNASPKQLADMYIQKEFATLGVKMTGTEDASQKGLRLYNEGKLKEALQQFKSIITSDTSDLAAKKNAGIVSLRLQEYDSAMVYFTQLRKHTELYSNPATFYLALTLMERNQPGDAVMAEQLLLNVVQNNLEGKEVAQEWLKKL
ncbi:MAG: hypothetical protein JST87_07550 [Bacteroidetes bacterium]|nr:hypothetical protein [Bacteroidota bacterium]